MGLQRRLEQLLLWHKFAILSVVGVIVAAIPATLYLRDTGAALDALGLEAAARTPVATILATIQTTQQHRGLAALVVGGVAESIPKREEKQREVDADFAAMADIVAGIHDPRIDAAFADAKRDWETLRGRVVAGTISVPESYEAHTALVPKLLDVEDQVADHYGLNLDPDVDSYQLIQAIDYQLPYLSEELGKMRAKGAGLLATKTATAEDRLVLSAIVARVADRLHQTTTQFDKAARANPALAAPLAGPMRDVREQAQQTMKLATEQIVKADPLTFSGPDYVRRTTAAIDTQYAFAAKATEQFNALLDARIMTLEHTRLGMLAAVAALFAFGGLMLAVIARSVTQPLNNAVEIAERVAAGDLTTDIAAGGRNETARLLASLGRMNDNRRRIVREVRVSVDTIGSAAGDIASGNADLSSRTESQASSLQETAASMEQITSTVKLNAENAAQANEVASQASLVARRPGRDRRGGDHGSDQRERAQDRRHHRRHRRHRLPDQHPRAERRGGSGARGRGRARLRGRCQRGAHARAAQRGGGQGNQAADRRKRRAHRGGQPSGEPGRHVDGRHPGERAARVRHRVGDRRRLARAGVWDPPGQRRHHPPGRHHAAELGPRRAGRGGGGEPGRTSAQPGAHGERLPHRRRPHPQAGRLKTGVRPQFLALSTWTLPKIGV